MKAIVSWITMVTAKIHQLRLILYAKFCSHLSIIIQEIGIANKNAIVIQEKKSRLIRFVISGIVAPLTFLIPISFFLC